MENFYSKFNAFGEWIYRLVLLNFIWMGFSLIGLGVLGIFPATAAMFALLRKWMVKKQDCRLIKDFAHYYKASFIKSNVIGYSIFAIWAIVWADVQYFLHSTNAILVILAYLLFLLLIGISMSMLMVFPIFVHYELSFSQYMKEALKYPITHVAQSMLVMLVIGVYMIALLKISGFFVFLGISFPCFYIAKVIFPTFDPKFYEKKGMYRKKKEESIYY